MKTYLFCGYMALALGCASMSEPKLGETYQHWARHTLVADLVYMEGNVKAYRAGGAVYYFRDDRLFKVDAGMAPRQQIELTVKQEAAASGTGAAQK